MFNIQRRIEPYNNYALEDNLTESLQGFFSRIPLKINPLKKNQISIFNNFITVKLFLYFHTTHALAAGYICLTLLLYLKVFFLLCSTCQLLGHTKKIHSTNPAS